MFAIEVGGNQTITQGVLDTAGGGLGGSEELCGGGASKCVFLSSTNQNGNLGGLTGADRICQNLADADGSLAAPGTYKAWLSTAAAPAAARLTHATVPYKLVDGTTIATNWDDLTDRALAAPINVTEGAAAKVGFAPCGRPPTRTARFRVRIARLGARLGQWRDRHHDRTAGAGPRRGCHVDARHGTERPV